MGVATSSQSAVSGAAPWIVLHATPVQRWTADRSRCEQACSFSRRRDLPLRSVTGATPSKFSARGNFSP
jgi:hypothetical protein